MKHVISTTIVSLLFCLSARAATDNLQRFSDYTGHYVISAESSYCASAYQALNLTVDASNKLIVTAFTGDGMLHGQPTAGAYNIEVALDKKTEIPYLNGRKFQRVVVDNNSIVTQESRYAPLFGQFGKWQNLHILLTFEKNGKITIHRGGYSCLFNEI